MVSGKSSKTAAPPSAPVPRPPRGGAKIVVYSAGDTSAPVSQGFSSLCLLAWYPHPFFFLSFFPIPMFASSRSSLHCHELLQHISHADITNSCLSFIVPYICSHSHASPNLPAICGLDAPNMGVKCPRSASFMCLMDSVSLILL